MPDADTRAATLLSVWVDFSWGFGFETHARFVRHTENVLDGDDTFVSCPLLDAEWDGNGYNGSVKDAPMILTVPSSLEPIATMLLQAHSPCRVEVGEMDPTQATTRRTRFFGTVAQITRNPGGRKGISKVTISGLKAMLRVPLGIIVDSRCPWTFGDVNCRINGTHGGLAAQVETGVITDIDGRQVTFSGVTTDKSKYWMFGVLEVDALRLMVMDYDLGDTLLLERPPPPSWLGVEVAFIPGCDRSLDGPTGCRFWNNERNFGGVGIGMPSYNPVLRTQ